MNKKLVLFLILITGVVSVMTIAVFGTLPENTNLERVSEIKFTNQYTLNEDNDKILNITDMLDYDTGMLTIDFIIEPALSEYNLRIRSSDESVSVLIDLTGFKINLFYDALAIDEKRTTTIRIWDTYTQKADEITLMFRNPDEVIIE